MGHLSETGSYEAQSALEPRALADSEQFPEGYKLDNSACNEQLAGTVAIRHGHLGFCRLDVVQP
jgi:hypothetical protein